MQVFSAPTENGGLRRSRAKGLAGLALYQRDHNVIPAALKLVKFYKNTQRLLEFAADSVAPNESINFISLWRDSLTAEGYNLGQVVMFTFITTRWNSSQLY